MSQQRKATPTRDIAQRLRSDTAPPKLSEDQANKLVAELLDGALITDDPIGLYLMGSLKDAAEERMVTSRNLQQAEKTIGQMRGRLIELKGVYEKSVRDLADRIRTHQMSLSPSEEGKVAPIPKAVPDIEEPKQEEPDPEPAV